MRRALFTGAPLRLQLVAVVLVLVSVALVVSGFFSTSLLRSYLTDRIDEQLSATAQLRIGVLENEIAVPQNPRPQPPGNAGPALLNAFYFKLVDAQGNGDEELRSPEGATVSGPKLPTLDSATVASLGTSPFEVQSVDGESSWRMLVRSIDDGRAVVVGSELGEVDSVVGRMRNITIGIDLAVLLLLSIVGYMLIRSRLKSLERMEETAGRIAEGKLDQRLAQESQRSEVGRLATAFNKMLARIETSFAAQALSEASAKASEARMRRFVADASHELMTPLTSIRGFAEVHRQGTAAGEIPPATHLMGRIEDEAQRMQSLVEDLLLLAHLDENRPLRNERVIVELILGEIVRDASVNVTSHSVELRIVGDSPIVVMGDAMRLKQVFLNLMNNVFRHTPAGTSLVIAVEKVSDGVTIDFTDNGPGMDENDARFVFERFFRADPSRSRVSGGSGLGLSIVKDIIETHCGSIELVTSPGKGASFRMLLPSSGKP